MSKRNLLLGLTLLALSIAIIILLPNPPFGFVLNSSRSSDLNRIRKIGVALHGYNLENSQLPADLGHLRDYIHTLWGAEADDILTSASCNDLKWIYTPSADDGIIVRTPCVLTSKNHNRHHLALNSRFEVKVIKAALFRIEN